MAGSSERESPDGFEPLREDDDLAFIREEGRELLDLFQRIGDKKSRDLVRELIRTLSDAEPDGA